ncbi:MAG: hypothetical protein K2J47_05305 [Ruminococcus sp.]|nr:hypothetical protein [Ruminococcus sp.]
MKEILDWKYNRFGITQLEESEVKRLVSCMEKNGVKCSQYSKSITIALTYKDIKFVCISYDPRGIKAPSPQICAGIFPDQIIFADCFSDIDENHLHIGRIARTTGDKELDKLFSQMAFHSPLWEEDIFAWLIDTISDSENCYPYEDEFEELRCEIMEYEYEMQKKYLTEKTVRPY